MTVSAPGPLYREYVANGSATDRSIGFPLRLTSDLRVTANDVMQTEGLHYSVVGTAPNLMIRPLAPFWANGTIIAYWRETARAQEYDIPPGVDLRNVSLEDELDRGALVDQELDREIARAVKVPLGETPPTVAELEAGAALAEAAAQIALAFSGPLYANTALGLAATVNLQEFAVDNGNGSAALYINNAGVATLTRTIIITPTAPGAAGLIGTDTPGGNVQADLDNIFARLAALET